MQNESFDVLVIGGGVTGSSIAYHVARQGRRVMVLERSEPGAEPSASWASAGGVRRQGRDQAEATLAVEAIERWRTLEDELEDDLHYRRVGNLKLAESDEEAEVIREFVRQQQAMGFDEVRFIDRAEAFEIVPGLNDRVVAGSYAASDGHANPPATAKAFASAAQRHGAVYRNGIEVTGLTTSGSRIIGVQTPDGTVEADAVVLAAGAWSDDIAATVGLRLPIRTGVYQMLLSTPAPKGILKPVIGGVSRSLSLKQLPGGEFFLGGGWPGDCASDRRSFTMRPESEAGNWREAVELLPAVGNQQVANKWCGLEAESIDGVPLIGAMPGYEGLTLAVGFTGHGFAISPAVGRAVADQLAGRETPELEGLRPDRITAMDDDAVDRFINEPVLARPTAG
ncbi:MAG: FAD-binding oxidoreductase [Chloroflexota bacterium]|nr:FAD-binding oxidoreductase [Chloroflexota bacterium]